MVGAIDRRVLDTRRELEQIGEHSKGTFAGFVLFLGVKINGHTARQAKAGLERFDFCFDFNFSIGSPLTGGAFDHSLLFA